MHVTLKMLRMRYSSLWEPRQNKDGKGTPKFQGTFLLDPRKNKEDIKLLNETIKKVAKDKWGAKADRVMRTIYGDKQKMFYIEDDMLTEDGDVVVGAEDMYYLRANNEVQPSLKDRDGTDVARRDNRLYNGAYVLVKLDVWAQVNQHGNGMRCELRGVQFMKDGEPFGGGTKASDDEFEDLSYLGDDDDDDMPKKSAKRRPVDDDDDEPRKPAKKRRPPVDDDDDDIG